MKIIKLLMAVSVCVTSSFAMSAEVVDFRITEGIKCMESSDPNLKSSLHSKQWFIEKCNGYDSCKNRASEIYESLALPVLKSSTVNGSKVAKVELNDKESCWIEKSQLVIVGDAAPSEISEAKAIVCEDHVGLGAKECKKGD